MTLSPEQFRSLTEELFGNRAGAKVAEFLGCSQALVSHFRTGRTQISDHYSKPLLSLAKEQGVEILDSGTVSPEIGLDAQTALAQEAQIQETNEEIAGRLSKARNTASKLVRAVLQNAIPSLIIAGGAGTGKSHMIRSEVEDLGMDFEVHTLKGVCSPPGLVRALWAVRDGGILVIDDCDSAFEDEDCLNMLKAALDSTENRQISYAKNASWLEKEEIDRVFDFCGSVIFLTNLDMRNAKGKLAPHFEALVSRSLYVDLTLKNRQEMCVWISKVIETGMLDQIPNPGRARKFTKQQTKEIVEFVFENANKFNNLDLRTAVNLANCVRIDSENWRELAEQTLM